MHREPEPEIVADRPPLPLWTAIRALVRCVGRTVVLLSRRTISQPTDQVGHVLRFADGSGGRIYRETIVSGRCGRFAGRARGVVPASVGAGLGTCALPGGELAEYAVVRRVPGIRLEAVARARSERRVPRLLPMGWLAARRRVRPSPVVGARPGERARLDPLCRATRPAPRRRLGEPDGARRNVLDEATTAWWRLSRWRCDRYGARRARRKNGTGPRRTSR